MSERGYAIVALDQPKCAANVGGVLRAAHAYGARMVVIGGDRYQRSATDTTKAWKHIPVLEVGDDVLSGLPVGCVPVAVDLIDGALPLPQFVHPERAFYIFGGEDRTLAPDLVSRCAHVVMVPTRVTLNLAAAVNVVLYDRMSKRPCRAERTKEADDE